MLIKIQNIEDECADLEDEVDELKRRINRMLKDEVAEKEQSKEAHNEDVQFFTSENMKYLAELKKLLTTFEEIKKDEDK